MTPFAIHFGFEFRSGVRNASAMLLLYLFPLGFYAMMGLVMVEINPDFADSMIPALVIVTAMAGTVLGLPAQLVEAREAGIHRSFKINGVGSDSILLIPMLATAVHVMLASLVITSTAGPLFGGAAPIDWVAFGGTLIVTVFAFGAIAALIGVISANTRATVLWSQLVFLPSMLIGGLMVDLSLLPESVLPAAKLLPSTYAMQAFLGTSFGSETVIDPGSSILVLLAGGLVAAVLARLLFAWDPRNQTRQYPAWLAILALAPFAVAAVLV